MWCVFVTNHRVEDNVLWVKLSTHVGNLLKMLFNSHVFKLRTSSLSMCTHIFVVEKKISSDLMGF